MHVLVSDVLHLRPIVSSSGPLGYFIHLCMVFSKLTVSFSHQFCNSLHSLYKMPLFSVNSFLSTSFNKCNCNNGVKTVVYYIWFLILIVNTLLWSTSLRRNYCGNNSLFNSSNVFQINGFSKYFNHMKRFDVQKGGNNGHLWSKSRLCEDKVANSQNELYEAKKKNGKYFDIFY